MDGMQSACAGSRAIKRQQLEAPPAARTGDDIFDTLSCWLDTPHLAYASWLSQQRLKDSTKAVYMAMFGRFCQWLCSNGLRLDKIEAGHIKQFLDSANPNLPESRKTRTNTGRQRQQYVRQLEKVYVHLAALGSSDYNPGRYAAKEKVGAGADKPTRFLNYGETRALIAHIQTRLAELREDQTSIWPSKHAQWMEIRDLALVGLMLGGGLKVGHAKQLTLSCIDKVEKRIDLSKPGQAHRARLLPFASNALELWLTQLAAMHSNPLQPNQKIFIADRSSGFGRTSKTPTLASSSVHRRTTRLLSIVGITGERACAQTLRNTYAGLLIDGGATDDHLVDYLGLQASVTAQRLRAAYEHNKQFDLPLDD